MSAVMGVLRVLQRPRTRCFLLAVVLAGVSLALLYHNLGPSGQQASSGPTPVTEQQQQVRLLEIQQDEDHPSFEKKVAATLLSITEPCSPVSPAEHVDIVTSDVYPTLNFNPHYRTYWNHSFERRYLKKREHWDKLPLKVIVVPHSHNDPGWLKTFDGYFMGSTAHILNNMVDKLARYKDMTFVFSEMSFFSRWWNSLKNRPHLRDQVRQFLERGQLELLTGGWVMTDEAAAHYYAMIDQLIEGHQWMITNLGMMPRIGWSIDSFGHSATVSYLLRASGLRNMVIQRTHYAWKAYLAEKEQLDFWWRQEFDAMARNNLSSDILCQMMPFDLYSIKHSCGPDPDVCLQFDFRRIPGEYSESRAVPVTPDKVAERAELLLGQYGRIGSLFPHNVALVPLGDDFRYNHDVEWDQQYENYGKLFEYINSRADWHAEVKFGTVSDYFHEVHKRMNSIGYSSIPTLVGDFHAYGDIYGEGKPSYWTGYFTTRPYWKHMCRDLQHWLRSAEIIYTLARAYVRQQGQLHLTKRLEQDYAYLTLARDSLGLFQHHDAITGTSKEAVMADYGMRLYHGIRETMGIIAHAALYIMAEDAVRRTVDIRPAHPLTSYIYPDIEQVAFDRLPEKVPLTIPTVGGRKIVVFNSKAHRSVEPIRVKIKSAFVKLLDPKGNEIPVQVNPAWNGSVDVLSDTYEALFLADLAPLSLSTYTFIVSESPPHPRSQISVTLNDAFSKQPQNSVFSFESPSESDIEVSSPYVTARFSKHTGLLKSMDLPGQDIINRVVMVLQAYKSEEFRSGAYLFRPLTSDPVQNVSGRFPIIRVVRGHLCSEVTAVYSNVITVTQRLYHSEGVLGTGLELEVVFDMNNLPEINLELFLRLQTDIQSGKVFYTDSNGFQMIKRVTHTQLPLEANFYPATSSVFLEDSRSRLTLLLSHAHGAASINSGWMEVMLDRRLRGDDNRGLGEGVLDNKKTMARFWLLQEKVDSGSPKEVPNLSVSGHLLSCLLSDSSIVVATHGIEQRNLKPTMEFLDSPLSCNVYMMNLRTIPMVSDFEAPSNNSLMILHHKGASCKVRSPIPGPCSQKGTAVNIALQHVSVSSVYRTSLTGLHPEKNVYNGSVVYMDPMQVYTYTLSFLP